MKMNSGMEVKPYLLKVLQTDEPTMLSPASVEMTQQKPTKPTIAMANATGMAVRNKVSINTTMPSRPIMTSLMVASPAGRRCTLRGNR